MRIEEIDSFLKYFSNVIRENPNFNFNPHTFYGEFISYDIPVNEREKDIYDYFEKWEKRFKHSQNLEVFWTPKQKRFLQFRNNKGDFRKVFKLYLSFPEDKIYEAANQIFDFIDKNDIETYSKIADMIRSDGVVLRITNPDDMKAVVNFINSNDFLVKNARKTNPFLMRNGVVGFAYDDTESFNSLVTKLLDIYFKNIKEKNAFDTVSIQDFSSFLDSFYQETFVNMNNLSNFNKDVHFAFKNYEDDTEKLFAFKQMAEFLTYSIKGNFSLDNYSSFVADCRDRDREMTIREKMHRKMDKDAAVYDEQLRNLLFNACCCTCDKYDKVQLGYALKKAIRGDYQSFSNGNDGSFYRRKLIKFLPSYKIIDYCLDILGRNDVFVKNEKELIQIFSDYIDSIVHEKHKKKTI